LRAQIVRVLEVRIKDPRGRRIVIRVLRPADGGVGRIEIRGTTEGYARVEGARGEVGCYLVSDGGPKPYRMKWRGASFSNLAVLPHVIPGHKVADVVAIMGSVDPVFGEVDR